MRKILTKEQRLAMKAKMNELRYSTTSYHKSYEIPSGIPKYKVKQGLNRIDIIEYTISNPENEKVKHLGYEIGNTDGIYEYYRHQNVGEKGEYMCNKRMHGEPCVICDRANALYKEDKVKEASKVKAKHRCVMNVIDLLEPEKGIQIWDVSYAWWGFVYDTVKDFKTKAEKPSLIKMRSETDHDIIEIDNYKDGRSIEFFGIIPDFCKADPKNKTVYYQPSNFSFIERKAPYDISILDEAYPLDTYEKRETPQTVENAYYGISEPTPVEPTPVVTPVTVTPASTLVENPVTPAPVTQAQVQTLESTPVAPRRHRTSATTETVELCEQGLKKGYDYDTQTGVNGKCEACSEDMYESCYQLHKKLVEEGKL